MGVCKLFMILSLLGASVQLLAQTLLVESVECGSVRVWRTGPEEGAWTEFGAFVAPPGIEVGAVLRFTEPGEIHFSGPHGYFFLRIFTTKPTRDGYEGQVRYYDYSGKVNCKVGFANGEFQDQIEIDDRFDAAGDHHSTCAHTCQSGANTCFSSCHNNAPTCLQYCQNALNSCLQGCQAANWLQEVQTP